MKRLTLVLLVLASATVYAQKPVKPNLNKALASLRERKYEEAKANIDAAITNDKLKDDGKTWYYRGLIYMSIDTSSNEQVNALAPDAYKTAMEAFAEADKRADPKKEYFIQDPVTLIPETKTQQVTFWANSHINKGAKAYDKEDYAAAVASFDKASAINSNDTLPYFYGGIAAMQSENWDKAIENFNKYIEKGGKMHEVYNYLYNAYNGPKADKEKALEVVREAHKKFPNNGDFAKLEIGLLIDLKRIDEAKSGLEAALKSEPDNKILHFYLGYANSQMNNPTEAKKNYENALKLDPQYFEAAYYLARLVYFDAIDIKKKMGQLGISAEDKKKKFEMDKILVEKLRVALPYWERAEKLNPSDQDVLDNLYTIYGDLDMQDQVKRIEKRYKELGYEN
jgi:tetratricopeptide (TPR) repeat protein